jgi:hypothetical protein
LVALAVVVKLMAFAHIADEQLASVMALMLPTPVLPVTEPFSVEVVHVMVEMLWPEEFVAVNVKLVPALRLASRVPV